MQLDELLSFATQTVYQAGRLTLGYFQTGVRPDFKADDTPVTVADRLAEEYIRRQSETRYPAHAIVGEEYGASAGGASAALEAVCRWYIDPIDGTKSFVRGVPLYAVLLGLEVEGVAQVGAAYFPALDELVAAATGLGCWWNGRRARVSEVDNLSRATLTFTDPANFAKHGKEAAWQRLQAATYYRAGWTDAYGYLLTATGRAELTLDAVMEDWDCGPFPPILSEAGGYFGDWQGHSTIHGHEGLATTQKLLPEVLRLIQSS